MMVRIRRMMIRVHEDQTEAIAARTAANLERAPPRRACDTATLIPMIPQSRPARLRQVEVGGVRDPQRVEEKRTKKAIEAVDARVSKNPCDTLDPSSRIPKMPTGSYNRLR
mmetsp:Transcript_16022/g.27981  ORF Transcript_16022/g.27981 Transcript_16022/m.27981 type:complete len:111 (+) Transcript_16022:118-450(+)